MSWGEIKNGQNIWLYETNGTEAQKFFLIENKDGTYMFVSSKNTGYALDVEGQKDGTLNANIHLCEKQGDHNQCFRIVKAEKKVPISICISFYFPGTIGANPDERRNAS